MTDLGDLHIPAAMRPAAEQVIALTDAVCADLLDEEYAALTRHVVAKLARKRPSPLQSGRATTWAGGVIWALGQVNFLFDRSSEPYVTHDDLADAFGLSKSTLSQKAKQVRDILQMTWGKPEFLRAVQVDSSLGSWSSGAREEWLYPVVHNAEMGRQPSPLPKLSESAPQ